MDAYRPPSPSPLLLPSFVLAGDAGLVALAQSLPHATRAGLRLCRLWGNAPGPGACGALRDALVHARGLQCDVQAYEVDGQPMLAVKEI